MIAMRYTSEKALSFSCLALKAVIGAAKANPVMTAAGKARIAQHDRTSPKAARMPRKTVAAVAKRLAMKARNPICTLRTGIGAEIMAK